MSRYLSGVQRNHLESILIPFFVSLYPALAAYTENLGQLRFEALTRTIYISIALAFISTLLFSLIYKSVVKGALLSTITMVLFFSYGHIYAILKQLTIGQFVVGRHRFLLPLIIGIWALCAFLLFRKQVSSLVIRFLLIFSIILFAIPFLQIVVYSSLNSIQRLASNKVSWSFQDEDILSSPETLPDIYYIVPDGYARSDILEEKYGYDNSGFINFLEDRGFVVAQDSNANYPATHQSLASSLNLDYVQSIVPEDAAGPKYQFNELLDQLIQYSYIRTFLESQGYRTVGFSTGYLSTELFDADIVYTTEMGVLDEVKARGVINPIESQIIDNSMLKILIDYEALESTIAAEYIKERMKTPLSVQREIILAQFTNLKKLTNINEPKFVFIHILSPHGPYKFGPNGEEITSFDAFSLKTNPNNDLETSSRLYTDELHYITGRLEETIDYILANSNRPVIIVLQSDHGPGDTVDEDRSAVQEDLDKFAILNAYYLPSSCQDQIYPEISPVNSFRVVLNCIFGANYQILEDIMYTGYDIFTPIENLQD